MSRPNGTHSSSPIVALAQLILHSAQKLDSWAQSQGDQTPFRDVSSPDYDPALEPCMPPEIINARRALLGATNQLEATVTDTRTWMYRHVTSTYINAALDVAMQLSIADIIKAQPSGKISIEDLSKQTGGADAHKLGRVLRHLCSNHIFAEVQPGVFANNRGSSVLLAGKVVDPRSPLSQRYDGTLPFYNWMTMTLETLRDGGKQLLPTLLDPVAGPSREPVHTPFARSFGLDMALWDIYALPDHAWRNARFDRAMLGTSKVHTGQGLVSAYDWSQHKGGLVVDVGGGIGSSTLTLARGTEGINFVVQDREVAIKMAHNFWKDQFPEAISSGQVKLSIHSFFDEQPLKGADVYMVRSVLHNWNDSNVRIILSQLARAAVKDKTKVLVIDIVCETPLPADSSLARVAAPIGEEKFDEATYLAPAPHPLLKNFGRGQGYTSEQDMSMLFGLNSQERSLHELVTIATQAGLKYQETVDVSNGLALKMIVFTKA